MPNIQRVRIVVAGVLAAGVYACNLVTSPNEHLSAARRRWAQGGPASYSVTLFRSCECTPEMSGPVVVDVRNGVVQARHYPTGGVVPPAIAPSFPNVDGLFDLIESARRQKAHRLEARYDRELGYPVWLVIDYDARIADDEFTFSVMEFVRF
jgi:uncharacterized protein DUF6174